MSQQKELKDGDSVQNPRVTWEGCSVLLDINDGDRLVFARLSSGSTLKIGNKNYSLKSLIGCPFGSVFQIQTGTNGSVLSRVSSLAQGNDVQENRDCTVKEECKDNRTIVDNNTAQNLTGEDIDAMRSQGATADEIVEALIANSTTFEKKTLFSQEKYRLKKQKKYAPRVLLRQPFARSICETYFKKYPARIGFLRVDTLSLLLSMANVGPGSDVLVFDMVGGILTGAVAERLGGTGYVCNTYLGDVPYPMDIVRIFNFSNKICESNSIHLKKIPMLDMATHELESVSVSSGPLQTRGSFGLPPTHGIVRCSSTSLHSASNETANDIEEPKDSSNRENYLNVISAEEILSGNDADIITEAKTPVVKACKSMKAGERASKEAITLWKENGFSSLIIAAPDMDAWKIVQEFLPLLSYSAPFAIYHQYLQPLATCMHNLQLGRMAIGMQISEPWLREYQVLPSRTHPCMQMNAFGGYILSGTRICNSESHL